MMTLNGNLHEKNYPICLGDDIMRTLLVVNLHYMIDIIYVVVFFAIFMLDIKTRRISDCAEDHLRKASVSGKTFWLSTQIPGVMLKELLLATGWNPKRGGNSPISHIQKVQEHPIPMPFELAQKWLVYNPQVTSSIYEAFRK